MSKIRFEINNRQVEEIVESLPLREKLHLARRLNAQTWQIRFTNLLSKIDRRLKSRSRLTNERIIQIVKKIRRRANA